MKNFFIIAALFSVFSFASDVPGGLIRTAEPGAINQYEIFLSPAYTLKTSGAYLTSELRFQPMEEMNVGFGFGAGEVGFHFGPSATWYLMPDTNSQPGIAILGGAYFNRVNQQNFFVMKVAPTVSKMFKSGQDKITPYAGLHFTPSFALGTPMTEFGIKTTLGTEFAFSGLNGIHLWTEFGLGLVNSLHEVVVGLSYPFQSL